MFRKSERGFTLIELLVVIAILGVLGGIAVPRVLGAVENARRNGNIANSAILQSAVERYTIDNPGVWPTDGTTTRPAAISPTQLGNYLTGGRLPRLNLVDMAGTGTPANFTILATHRWGLDANNLVVVILPGTPGDPNATPPIPPTSITVVWTPAP